MNASLRLLRRLAVYILALGILHTAVPVWAQSSVAPIRGEGSGFDLRLFRPAVDSKGQFTVNGTDILGAGDLSFGLIVDGAGGLARTGANRASIVSSMFSGVLSANVGIANLLVVGVQVPVQLVSGPGSSDPAVRQTDLGDYTPPMSGLNFQGIGDLTLHAKFRWLRAEYFPVGLAIVLQGGFGPTGGARYFAGEPGGFLWPGAVIEWRPSRRVRVNLNLGTRIPFARGSHVGSMGNAATYGPSATWGLGASFRVVPVLDLVAETYGQVYLSGGSDVRAALPFEVVAGAKIFVQRNSYLMLGGGTGHILSGLAAADVRGFAGFVYEPSIGDTDGDGYRDDVDQCVSDPEDFDGFQDEDGCSEPDNDRDGIVDANDQCPLVPEDRDSDHDEDGCPEGEESDRDGDGIMDRADRCPDEPEDRDGFQDGDGCPDPDNDNDTIPDTVDQCPNDPEDFDGFEDEDGCPDPDNDRDGIPDVRDRDIQTGQDCKNFPETMNGLDDDDGCPDSGDLQIQGNVITLRDQIQFETDSAEIRSTGVNNQILDQMANLLRRNAQFALVEVEGHTDERAADEHNLQLSNDRANAVMQALIHRGIDASRLVAAGYGEYCPLDPRHNPQAWERNRRVQFVIVRTRDEGRTTATAGCRRGVQYIPTSIGPPGTGVAREGAGSASAPTSHP